MRLLNRFLIYLAVGLLWVDLLFNSDALGQISWFVDVTAFGFGDVVCEQLSPNGL